MVAVIVMMSGDDDSGNGGGDGWMDQNGARLLNVHIILF